MSITRCPGVAKALGKLQGALASAIDQLDKAAQAWFHEGFADSILDDLRRSIADAVDSCTSLQVRFRALADEAWKDRPGPRQLFDREEA